MLHRRPARECGLGHLRLRFRLRVRIGFGCKVGHELHDPFPVALVPPLDLGAEAGSEALLGRQLDPVLRRKGACELGPGDEAELDDRLAEPLSRPLLLCQSALEVVAGEEPLLDEQPPEGPPGDVGRFHLLIVGESKSVRNASFEVGLVA